MTVDAGTAELMTVGPDEVVVTFAGDADEEVVTRLGELSCITVGPFHVARFTGLESESEYPLTVDGLAPAEPYLPGRVRTLPRPRGPVRATVATVNDVHFGETECGGLGTDPEVGPILTVEPGEPPYPVTMNRAAISEIADLAPDAIVVKGDLTDSGREEEYAQFLAAYGSLGPAMHHVRGNHDAMRDPSLACNGAPYAVEVGGVTLAVLDTVIPGDDRGRVDHEQLGWLTEAARATSGPMLVFGHHPVWNVDHDERPASYFGLQPDDSDALVAVVRAHENIVGYFSGHTHRNRVRRFARTGPIPFVEIGAVKDYPGCWSEYRIHDAGFTQVVRRISAPEALRWTERTRAMFAGLYRDYALGPLAARAFTEVW